MDGSKHQLAPAPRGLSMQYHLGSDLHCTGVTTSRFAIVYHQQVRSRMIGLLMQRGVVVSLADHPIVLPTCWRVPVATHVDAFVLPCTLGRVLLLLLQAHKAAGKTQGPRGSGLFMRIVEPWHTSEN